MRTWLDRSPALLLACCTCGWRDVAVSTVHGWRLVADHASAVHDDAEGRYQAQVRASNAARSGRIH